MRPFHFQRTALCFAMFDKLKAKATAKMEEKMGVDLDGDGVVGRPGGKPSSSDDGDSHHGLMGAMGAAAGLWAMSSGDSESESDDDHTGAALLAAGAVGLGGLAFFYAMNRKKKRDYVVVVDASCSMQSGVFQPPGGTRWSETHNAIRSIAAGLVSSFVLLVCPSFCVPSPRELRIMVG